MPEKPEEEGVRSIARNPKAWHRYRIGERWEAGLALMGSEVKSLRMGRATLTEGFVQARGQELWLHGMNIPEYPQASYANHDPARVRKLLLHRRQIAVIAGHLAQKGNAVVPLSLYFKKGVAKVEIALARGKTHADKREDLKKKESDREVSRELARRRRE